MINDLRTAAFINGILIVILGTAMIIPTIICISSGNNDWSVFAIASMACLFIGVSLSVSTHITGMILTIRAAFIMTTLAWIGLVTFSALPFAWSELNLSYTDAFFEAMSGLTTTGATVIDKLDQTSSGLLLWRGLLQWLGGLGIIMMAIAILPLLQVGGMQVFKAETFDTPEKILPSTAQMSTTLSLIYISLTLLCAIIYDLAGMSTFDAIIHAMTTIATGGFSSHDASIAYFDSTIVESISIIFMIIGSLPFIFYIKAMQGNVMEIFRDSQVRTFFLFLIVFSICAVFSQPNLPGVNSERIQDAIFTVTSLMTGTGYVSAAYDTWSPLAIGVFISVMFIGGCAGSTSCGIKIFRFQILYITLKQHLNQILYPHGTFVPIYNGKPLSDTTISSVMSFLFLHILSILFFSLLLTLDGYDLISSLSASISTISNVGPGLGKLVGPSTTFATLSDETKWILSIAMLLGRLELFAVIVPFSMAFWRN